MIVYRNGTRIAALAAALALGLLAMPKAQAFTFENKEAANGSSLTEKDLSSSRYGSGKSSVWQQNGFSIEMKQYGSSQSSGPSDDRNVNDLAPRYDGQRGMFR